MPSTIIQRLCDLQDQNTMLLNKLQHTDTELNTQLRQAREALASRTQELDSLKLEWTSRTNDLSTRHGKEIHDERDKHIKVINIIIIMVKSIYM